MSRSYAGLRERRRPADRARGGVEQKAKKRDQRRLENAVLGDFLGLAKTALAEGHKDVAAVLASAALEDAVKRLSLHHGIDVERKKLQDLVGALKAKGLVGGKDILEELPKQRDNAMHALWGKISAPSVNAMIAYVEQLSADNFS